MRLRPAIIAAVLFTGGVLALYAQDATFRVEVALVRVLATVKSDTGELVGSLDQDEFKLFDSGVEQEITLFERHTDQPLSVALLVDTSASAASRFGEEVSSVLRFVDTVFKQGNTRDAITFYSFNHDVTQEASFTRSVKRISKELKSLQSESGTSLYDAIYFASRSLRYRKGRRVIVLVTDGADTTSIKNFQQAIEAAHDADAVLYGIMIIPVTNDAGRHIAGENALISLCTGTGGRVFAASLGDALDSAFDSILADLRTQYFIGYYPKDIPASNERFHKIEVKLNRPGLQAFTRSGYYGEYRDSRSPASARGGPSIKPRQQE